MELLKHISGYTLISVITGAISFLLLPILTKHLSPEDYGILSIFNASTRFLAALIPLGMSNLLLVYLIEKKKEYPLYLKSFVKTTFIICVFCTTVISIILFFINDLFGLPPLLAISLPLIALMIVYLETISSYFIYLKQFKNYAKYTLVKFFIEIALVIVLVILYPFNWKGRIAALAISLLLICIYATFYFVKNKILQLRIKTTYHNKDLIKKGSPLVFMGISIMVMNLSDRFFIEYFVGLKETGIYGIASTLAGILLMIIGALLNVLRPIIYEKLKLGDNLKELNKLTFKFTTGLLTASVLLYFSTPILFKHMINERFHNALELTSPLIFSLFFWGIYSYFSSFLMYLNQTKIIGVISILSTIFNLFLNYFFVLHYGSIGAAYSTLITYFVISIIIYIFYLLLLKKHLNIV